MTTRAARRRALRGSASQPTPRSATRWIRPVLFAGVIVAVLGVGGYLAFGDFLRRPAPVATTAAGGAAATTIDVQSSMAGFTPSEIRVKAGSTVALNWWTQDAAVHLQGGVHTMVAPDLGLREELPAESTRVVSWQVPDKPGTYDVWCETCCGGKDSPQMHGKIVVEASA